MRSFRWVRGGPTRLLSLCVLAAAVACGDGSPAPDVQAGEDIGAPTGDTPPAAGSVPVGGPPPGMVPPQDETVRGAADRAVTLLESPDLVGLAGVVHPERGVLFSPYASVDPESVTLSSEDLRALEDSDPVRLWGYRDGSGEPIESSFGEYHRDFVYGGEFRTAPRVSVDERIGVGTTTDNIRTVFPDGVTVEYHLPGTDPQYEGLDWRSLRLVFVQEDNRWWLVGVIHDQWTT